MEIILLKDVSKVGDKHEIVTVKNGYGRNYLIPQGLAIIANEKNRARLDKLMEDEAAVEAAKVGEYQEMADKIKDQTIKIGAKAGTSGKIFGSVTSIQIAQVLKDQFGIEIARKKVEIPEEVKTIGTYKAIIKFHPEVIQEVEIEVVEE
jgi:large subunit ribosomal protein L9